MTPVKIGCHRSNRLWFGPPCCPHAAARCAPDARRVEAAPTAPAERSPTTRAEPDVRAVGCPLRESALSILWARANTAEARLAMELAEPPCPDRPTIVQHARPRIVREIDRDLVVRTYQAPIIDARSMLSIFA